MNYETLVIDALADDFEAAWNAGESVCAEAFLESHGEKIAPESREKALAELQAMETELRAKFSYAEGVPTRLGNYELLELVGSGGMGDLYRARHRLLDKIVAVKMLSERISHHPLAIKRFERELRLHGNLLHRNIVHALSAEHIGKHLLLVMEFVSGKNLHQIVETEGRRSLEEALYIVREVASGLQYAFEQGIVHRDIKPANIMLSETHEVKILDFGLGKYSAPFTGNTPGLRQGDSPLTALGFPLGTLSFLAPEQWDSPENIDIRADIYALGCTFYYLLTGVVPFSTQEYSSVREKMMAHLLQPIPPLANSGIRVGSEVEHLFRKMTEKEREKRFATPQAILQAIDAMSVSQATSKEIFLKPPHFMVFRRFFRSKRFKWGTITVSMLILLLGLSRIGRRPPKEDTPNPVPSGAVEIPHKGINEAESHTADVTPSEVETILSLVLTSRYHGDVRTARRLSRELLDQPPSDMPQSVRRNAEELLADCTLFSAVASSRAYEFYIEEADELYRSALVGCEDREQRQVLRSKLAMLRMMSGEPLLGLRILETGKEDFSGVEHWQDSHSGKLSRGVLFFETAKGLGGYLSHETHVSRQDSLRRVLDAFRLNLHAIKQENELERLDLQLLCIRQLLQSSLDRPDLETAKQDCATYLAPILLGWLAERRDLRPYLRQNYNLAIRSNDADVLKQAEYIYSERMESTRREGVAQLLFYFDQEGGFAIFLAHDFSERKRFPLPWTHEDIRRVRVSPTRQIEGTLDTELVHLVQAEWESGRHVALSWADTLSFCRIAESIDLADWPFEDMLPLHQFVGIEK